jgi:hypothetical protein
VRTVSLSLLTILCLMLAVAPAMADLTLYSNGPVNGTTDAWAINFGFSVSDSFDCSYSGCIVDELHIGVWLTQGDSLTSVEMQLGSTSFGNQYADLVLNVAGHTDLGINQFGEDVQIVDFGPFYGFDVMPGTNWITLQNAVTPAGNPVYWDENGGPSSAYENTLGSIPSEAFTVTGNCMCCSIAGGGPDCRPPVPEPSSIMLLGSGILGLVGVLRRKLGR